jgi:ADP-ribose 1''-phosphate phosphatase
MSNIVTIKGSLFSAPKGSIIIHACNTKGMWGSGIAKAFAQLFPDARNIYAKTCQEKGASLLGTCLIIPSRDYYIGCLFTSKNYGQYVDKPDKILLATRLAIADLILQNGKGLNLPMHMCKINSGLFNVPWSDTKKILKETGKDFTVYDY